MLYNVLMHCAGKPIIVFRVFSVDTTDEREARVEFGGGDETQYAGRRTVIR